MDASIRSASGAGWVEPGEGRMESVQLAVTWFLLPHAPCWLWAQETLSSSQEIPGDRSVPGI